jgi:ABC-2 type transport system permease protein
VVPVAFLTTVPAEALLGKPQPGSLLAAVTLALVCLAGSRALWWLALRHYTSASS